MGAYRGALRDKQKAPRAFAPASRSSERQENTHYTEEKGQPLTFAADAFSLADEPRYECPKPTEHKHDEQEFENHASWYARASQHVQNKGIENH